ncbi:MAG: hypothetical protein IJ986_06725 [Bacteroidales bacterium]|nr:hypothetical protein [Bacteroidales bacterium]
MISVFTISPFFRGKPTVRFYRPVSVPRWAVTWHPRRRRRSATLPAATRFCALTGRGTAGCPPTQTHAVRSYNHRQGTN